MGGKRKVEINENEGIPEEEEETDHSLFKQERHVEDKDVEFLKEAMQNVIDFEYKKPELVRFMAQEISMWQGKEKCYRVELKVFGDDGTETFEYVLANMKILKQYWKKPKSGGPDPVDQKFNEFKRHINDRKADLERAAKEEKKPGSAAKVAKAEPAAADVEALAELDPKKWMFVDHYEFKKQDYFTIMQFGTLEAPELLDGPTKLSLPSVRRSVSRFAKMSLMLVLSGTYV